ncbi:hypothetical protein NGM10_09920 [Halorussus salilacus]|uniref:hypothetical protein n=1 Tax=Halorussus salilacus TaxID=2953750 RepID=UPI0020A202C6|nr:hypothetical protein [Halorussus salilacus]USZ67046.1 hypothetical protein NGM10_09920 [Halorussus salilacus]
MSTDDLEVSPEGLSREELLHALKTGEITIQEVRENEALRQQVRQLIVKRDMEKHREIYDRLAEV